MSTPSTPEEMDIDTTGVSVEQTVANLTIWPEDFICSSCSKFPDEAALMRYGRCEKIYYCSKQCQNRHWRVHEPFCHPPSLNPPPPPMMDPTAMLNHRFKSDITTWLNIHVNLFDSTLRKTLPALDLSNFLFLSTELVPRPRNKAATLKVLSGCMRKREHALRILKMGHAKRAIDFVKAETKVMQETGNECGMIFIFTRWPKALGYGTIKINAHVLRIVKDDHDEDKENMPEEDEGISMLDEDGEDRIIDLTGDLTVGAKRKRQGKEHGKGKKKAKVVKNLNDDEWVKRIQSITDMGLFVKNDEILPWTNAQC